MIDEKESILKELDHLERTYKSGLIGESEYIKHQKTLNKKLNDLIKAKVNKEKQKEFIEKTLGWDIMAVNKTVNKKKVDEKVDDVDNKYDNKRNDKPYNTQEDKKSQNKRSMHSDAKKSDSKPKSDAKTLDESNQKDKHILKEESFKKSIKNKHAGKDHKSRQEKNKSVEKPDNRNVKDESDIKSDIHDEGKIISNNLKRNNLEKNKKVKKHDKSEKEELNVETFNTNQQKSKIWNWLIVILLFILIWQSYNLFFVSSPQASPQGGSLTIYEYTDFACDYCAEVQKALRDVYDYYQGNVQIELKHYPISNGDVSLQAAYYVECMRKVAEKRYDFLFQRHLYDKGDDLKRSDFADFIGTFDIDSNALGACLDSSFPEEQVSQDIKDANELGITSVPTVVIGDKKIVGAQPFEVYKYYIDQELKVQQ